MNFKKSILFVSAFIVITVIVLVIEKPFQESSGKPEQDIQKLFPALEMEKATKIKINQVPEQTFDLQKTDKGWVVANQNNFPCNSHEIEELLKRVSEFDTASLVSRNPENQVTFQVNKIGIETQIRDTSDNVLAHFFVGKNGPDFMSTYVRAEGSDNVYLQNGYLQTVFDKSKTKWRDVRVLVFEKEDVSSIALQFSRDVEGKKPQQHDLTVQSVTEADRVVWNIVTPEPFPAKAAEMTRIVNALATLTADDVATDKTLSETGLETPLHTFTVTMKDGLSHTLNVGLKHNSTFYVKNTDKEHIFTVAEYKINNLMKTFDELKDEERKKAEEAAAQQADTKAASADDPVSIKVGP